MDFTVGRVVCTPADTDSDCVLPNDAPVVRISTGDSYYCLPDSAIDALGRAERPRPQPPHLVGETS